jgi:hypothetical protein
MSHLPGAGDPGWPELLPPDRNPRTPRPPEASDDLDDDLFAGWEPQRRVTRLTVVLAACLLVVAGFAVGAVVAKRATSGTTATAAGLAGAGGAAAREGFGGFGGGAGGFRGGGTTGAGTTGGAGTGSPVVVGTVASVAANRITVTNFAGKTVVVRVPPRTPVTTPGLGGLKKGQTVSVEGTRASDGSVTATAVVSRS